MVDVGPPIPFAFQRVMPRSTPSAVKRVIWVSSVMAPVRP